MAGRRKPRITVTLDPDMLREVDAYIQEHTGLDRSRVMDEALRCWYARNLHNALIAQHGDAKSTEDAEERLAWKRIRAAQLSRAQRKHQAPEQG